MHPAKGVGFLEKDYFIKPNATVAGQRREGVIPYFRFNAIDDCEESNTYQHGFPD
jgi:hypothetical protein